MVNVRGAEFHADPYTALAELRRKGRLHHHAASGLWFLLRFDDVAFGLAEVRRDERNSRDPLNPFAMDGPAHTGPRRLITPSLSNRAVQALHGRTRQIVDEALGDKPSGAELRLAEEIGYPLPYRLMCTLLGVPELDDPTELRDVTFKSLALIDAFLTPDQTREYLAAAATLYEHLGEVVEWKRGHMSDDLMSVVIRAGDAGEVMRPEHVVPYLHTLYLAGMHTTVNQISLSLLALMRDRTQWHLLLDQPSLLENAIEELLRYEPTAQYMTRTALEDIEFGDVTVPKGSRMVAWIASANRDEEHWGPTADRLDVTRADARNHIAFGKGAHVCVGSWLARLELRVVIETLLRRYPKLDLATEDVAWENDISAIRGPQELVLRLAS
jgi:cytochrome P450